MQEKRHNFLNLIIWKKAMDLTDLVFQYNQGLPSSERFNLIDQMNGNSCSIPSSIAEGSGKRTKKLFEEYLSISLSLAFELHTQLLICERRKYRKIGDLEVCINMTRDLQKMIFSFKENLRF